MIGLSYFHARRLLTGRYAVAHMLPGAPGSHHVDADCISLSAAQKLCAEMEAARNAQLRSAATERALCGLRQGALL